MLTFKDFLIFYLACGAPMGASYFFRNRKKFDRQTVWLMTFLTFIVWIPYALKLLHEFITRKISDEISFNNFSAVAWRQSEISRLEKEFTQLLAESGASINIFEFREVFSRYTGLSTACLSIKPNARPRNSGREIFRLSGHINEELGVRCLYRQNASKLRRHQKLAEKDLFAFLTNSAARIEYQTRIRQLACELLLLFKDEGDRILSAEFFSSGSQTFKDPFVSNSEKELWKIVNTQQLQNLKQRPESPSTLIAKFRQD